MPVFFDAFALCLFAGRALLRKKPYHSSMKNIFLLALLSVTVFACTNSPAEKEAVEERVNDVSAASVSAAFAIEILDQEGNTVIDSAAKIEVLAGGFSWAEGPLWIADGEYLLFSDVPNNKVYKLTSGGDTSTYLAPSGQSGPPTVNPEPGSNGLLLNPAGELVLMQHGDRRVAKMNALLSDPVEKYVVLTDAYRGKRFNSPNDGTFDAAGNLYFTDPPYGLPGKMDDPGKELGFQGVFFLPPNGEPKLLDSLTYPNGVALSPDGQRLYVAVSDPKHAVWYQYDLTAPGEVTNKRIFHDLTHLVGQKGQQGLPDGLKVNKDGYVFATGAGGVWIFNPDGKPLARIHTGQATANCALAYGGKRLFMTADGYVLGVGLR